ncbi:MAG: helix-turn-helix transcriptional regulator [Lachnospiraceae bacterium]|nr:helix-turn-helix transcriptional regulator [Lachnospiraceae bacterium]
MLYQIEVQKTDYTTSWVHSLSPLPHIHLHLELIYLKEGSSMATLDNKEFLIKPGSLFLSFPNQIHFYHDRTPLYGVIVIFSPDMFRELKELFHNQTPTSPILEAPQLPSDIFERMVLIREKYRSEDSFDNIVANGSLLALLGEILPQMTLIPNTSDQDSIRNILQYCQKNYTESLSLDELSKKLHLNKYYISHMFKERLNISFTDFVNGLRVEHACNLLKQGHTITEVAFSSGFASIRNFNRVFLKNMGMTPREYLNKKQ